MTRERYLKLLSDADQEGARSHAALDALRNGRDLALVAANLYVACAMHDISEGLPDDGLWARLDPEVRMAVLCAASAFLTQNFIRHVENTQEIA